MMAAYLLILNIEQHIVRNKTFVYSFLQIEDVIHFSYARVQIGFHIYTMNIIYVYKLSTKGVNY